VRDTDGAPFIAHPVEVARLLHHAGAPVELVAVGLLHDAVEKHGASVFAIRTAFGARIAALVETLTDDPAIHGFAPRKARLLEQVAADDGNDALLVLAADKIAKVRDLRAATQPPAPADLADRREHYEAALRLVQRRLPEHALTRTLALELQLLDVSPRRRVPTPRRREHESLTA
jgi:(p)ppGpp synthase/HD superfamily hydrolase